MCTRVYNRDTEQEAQSPKELRTMVGVEPKKCEGYTWPEINEEACLCQVDVKATVEEAGYGYVEIDNDPMDVQIWKVKK